VEVEAEVEAEVEVGVLPAVAADLPAKASTE
jgi:hypothetical protein